MTAAIDKTTNATKASKCDSEREKCYIEQKIHFLHYPLKSILASASTVMIVPGMSLKNSWCVSLRINVYTIASIYTIEKNVINRSHISSKTT